MGCWLARSDLGRVPLWTKPVLVVGPVSLKETDPLLLLFSFIFLF
jgi:hypothetical protein